MREPERFAANQRILSRDGKEVGLSTGSLVACPLEGCRGVRVYTRWLDGRLTKPCSRGLIWRPRRHAWQIE
jgi:hypothetical protein